MKRLATLALLSATFATSVPAGAQPAAAGTIVPLVRQKIKHVFVIYQENRSYDSYFGTFPRGENLASPVAQTQGYKQYDALGGQWVMPFRITAADTADADHSRRSLITKADAGKMDLYVGTEEFGLLAKGYSKADAQRVGLLTMSHEDCDTIPFLWKYADNFTLFDHFFQGMYGPSTPGNIDLIAAQTGQTQFARDPVDQVAANGIGRGLPIVNDTWPAYGPYPTATSPDEGTLQFDQTYATLFLTLAGKAAPEAKVDTDDIKDDIVDLAHRGHPAVPWGWYQEGFATKPGTPEDPYVVHHNALQYFGYLRRNDFFWKGVHDVTELLPAIQGGKLGDEGVVFVKGGYHNPFGWAPADKNPYVQQHFMGDDDHPGYSDSQISESFVATFVNAIARSKYWNDSAILILWDDSEGFYDHMAPPVFERCPDGSPCGDGPRVPAMLISPFAKDHAIVSDLSDHASFAKFLGKVFDLPALASLPDEKPFLPMGPRDGNERLSDLLGAFDAERLSGTKRPIPASAAEIDDTIVGTFPAKMSCSTLAIKPATLQGDALPQGFAPLTLEH